MNRDLEERNFVDLPDALIQALGEVSVRYGQIEYLLTMAIHRTERISYDDAIAKVENLKYGDEIRREAKRQFKTWALVKFGDVEGKRRSDDFDALVDAWAQVAERRHDIIHCCWTVGKEDGELTGTRKGNILMTDGRLLEIEDVQELGNDLCQVVFRLNTATKSDWLNEAEVETIKIIPSVFTPGLPLPSNLETTATAVAFEPTGPVKEDPTS